MVQRVMIEDAEGNFLYLNVGGGIADSKLLELAGDGLANVLEAIVNGASNGSARLELAMSTEDQELARADIRRRRAERGPLT